MIFLKLSHYKKDVELIKRIQYRFSRLFPELKVKPYHERLNELGLCSLEERRNRTAMVEVLKA